MKLAKLRRYAPVAVTVAAIMGVLIAAGAAARHAPVQRRIGFVTTDSTAAYASINGESVNVEDQTVTDPRVVVLTVTALDPERVGVCGITVDGRVVATDLVYDPGPTTCMWLAP